MKKRKRADGIRTSYVTAKLQQYAASHGQGAPPSEEMT
jgi:hypothetical protein